MLELDILEKFHKDVRRGFHPELPIKLNRSEVDLLMVVKELPKRPFEFYGHHIHLEKSSFSYVVDLVSVKGLVEATEDPYDRRRKSLELTPKGLEFVDELTAQYQVHYDQKMSIFSAEELKTLETSVAAIKILSKKLRDDMDKKEKDEDFRRPPRPRDE
ncbi:MAG: MarR family winged helix-turn-helix transcriptional regulator [Acholeplasmataceae bacterium]